MQPCGFHAGKARAVGAALWFCWLLRQDASTQLSHLVKETTPGPPGS